MKFVANPKRKNLAGYCYCGTNTTACNDFETCTHVELPDIPVPPKGK